MRLWSWLRTGLPTVAALLVIVVTVCLGFWQLDRARQRDALDAQQKAALLEPGIELGRAAVDAVELELKSVQAQGEWVTDKVAYLDNQVYKGRVGFHIFMPLKLADSDTYVLVNRGWIAGTVDRSLLPPVTSPRGRLHVRGFARQAPPHYTFLGGAANHGQIWSELSIAGYSKWSGLPLQTVMLYQTNDAADGLIRDWALPKNLAEHNRGYAIQWFAFALMTLIFWGVHFGKRHRPKVENGIGS